MLKCAYLGTTLGSGSGERAGLQYSYAYWGHRPRISTLGTLPVLHHYHLNTSSYIGTYYCTSLTQVNSVNGRFISSTQYSSILGTKLSLQAEALQSY